MAETARRARRLADRTREGARLLGAIARERIETGIVFNPLRHRDDPYPHYRRLRERDPVHRSRAAYGWIVTRYEDVLEILRDRRFSADDRRFVLYPRIRAQQIREGLAKADEEDAPIMLRIDPPVHTRLRGLVSKAFTPRAVEKLRPRVEAVAEELLAPLGSALSMDVIRDFAVPLPVTIIAEMLGVPAEDRERFKRWSDVLVGFIDPAAAAPFDVQRATIDEFQAYVGAVVAKRRQRPADDLLSALVLAEEAGDRLSEPELFGTVALLLAAGNETTTNLIGNGLLALLRHPAELERLRAEPDLTESAVEEFLRFDSPVQVTGRIPTEDLEFRGRRFRTGQMIVLVLAAANRDPAAFSDPDRLDVARSQNRHLSFGHGVHYCLGAQLARLEGQIALRELVRRFPAMRLATERPRWRPGLVLRGLASLPVAL